jgi:phosphatidylinositol-bisphosphatase
MSGTRFHSRGIDENQNASNFVETEEIFICHNYLFSHISTRGSVPIFW